MQPAGVFTLYNIQMWRGEEAELNYRFHFQSELVLLKVFETPAGLDVSVEAAWLLCHVSPCSVFILRSQTRDCQLLLNSNHQKAFC